MLGLMLVRTAKRARNWSRSSVDVHGTIVLLLLLRMMMLLLQGRVLLSVVLVRRLRLLRVVVA
jgi:hypothetical protein